MDEHLPQVRQLVTVQSVGQGLRLGHFLVCFSEGQRLPPLLGRTLITRRRVCVPLLQLAVQTPHAPHALAVQSTGQK